MKDSGEWDNAYETETEVMKMGRQRKYLAEYGIGGFLPEPFATMSSWL